VSQQFDPGVHQHPGDPVDVSGLHLLCQLYDQVAGIGISAGQFWHWLQQAERYVFMMFDNGFFTDPVQCWHDVTLDFLLFGVNLQSFVV
jgi:hypothetical protein